VLQFLSIFVDQTEQWRVEGVGLLLQSTCWEKNVSNLHLSAHGIVGVSIVSLVSLFSLLFLLSLLLVQLSRQNLTSLLQ
jgi:hypothetical protein